MLRSRGNRSQKPSESTDEQAGGNYYGGYPASATVASPMMGVSRGDDDYGSGGAGYKKTLSGSGSAPYRKSSSFSGMGGGGGARGGGGSINAASRGPMMPLGGERTIKGNKNSTGCILISFALVALMALGGATFHYKRGVTRLRNELEVFDRRIKMERRHPGRRHLDAVDDDESANQEEDSTPDDNNDNNNNNNDLMPQDNSELRGLQSQQQQLQNQSNQLNLKIKSLENALLGLKHQKNAIEKETSSHQAQIKALNDIITSNKDKVVTYKDAFLKSVNDKSGGVLVAGTGAQHVDSLEELEQFVEAREDALWEKIDALVDMIEMESAREVMELFGGPPHYVKMEIEYPEKVPDTEPTEWTRKRGVFVIELAPMELMPHAVNVFLQQIHHKVWNGCSFVINAMHIMQAGPHKYVEPGKYDANNALLFSKFQQNQLDKVAFQEYHEDYPHSAYTLGFAGRPGGPDFYINKIDNAVNHGPGGQGHHDLHEEADPCFGRIIRGKEIISQVNKVPVDHEKGGLLLQPVTIIDAIITYGEMFEIEE